ncbi:uncharacterized protein LOC131615215 [Vicia villosa]|uniref:uncharacterized protein LOC131615215 n=1 Tax=Vicia villosa TaxID=3911 RepID=UPI00273B6EFD|nr:uncharacterized protein LOC131615215 [Vicia villosa]
MEGEFPVDEEDGSEGYNEDGWEIVRRDLDMEIRDKYMKGFYERLFGDQLSEVRNGLMIDNIGFQPPEKWLTLPDMGYLIVNRYNVILVHLGNLCLTLFPMTTPHSSTASIYYIRLVNNDRWIQVNMKDGLPLPRVTIDWKMFHSQVSTSWMLGFAGRLQYWIHLSPMIPSYVSLE